MLCPTQIGETNPVQWSQKQQDAVDAIFTCLNENALEVFRLYKIQLWGF